MTSAEALLIISETEFSPADKYDREAFDFRSANPMVGEYSNFSLENPVTLTVVIDGDVVVIVDENVVEHVFILNKQ